MIVLDTNVMSELMQKSSTARVERFFAMHRSDAVTTAVTIYEISYGIARLPISARRDTLTRELHKLTDQLRPERLLALDVSAAERAASFRAQRDRMGRPMSVQDALIAGICAEHGATLATRNVKDFEGVGLDVVNPWEFGE